MGPIVIETTPPPALAEIGGSGQITTAVKPQFPPDQPSTFIDAATFGVPPEYGSLTVHGMTPYEHLPPAREMWSYIQKVTATDAVAPKPSVT